MTIKVVKEFESSKRENKARQILKEFKGEIGYKAIRAEIQLSVLTQLKELLDKSTSYAPSDRIRELHKFFKDHSTGINHLIKSSIITKEQAQIAKDYLGALEIQLWHTENTINGQ